MQAGAGTHTLTHTHTHTTHTHTPLTHHTHTPHTHHTHTHTKPQKHHTTHTHAHTHMRAHMCARLNTKIDTTFIHMHITVSALPPSVSPTCCLPFHLHFIYLFGGRGRGVSSDTKPAMPRFRNSGYRTIHPETENCMCLHC